MNTEKEIRELTEEELRQVTGGNPNNYPGSGAGLGKQLDPANGQCSYSTSGLSGYLIEEKGGLLIPTSLSEELHQ